MMLHAECLVLGSCLLFLELASMEEKTTTYKQEPDALDSNHSDVFESAKYSATLNTRMAKLKQNP